MADALYEKKIVDQFFENIPKSFFVHDLTPIQLAVVITISKTIQPVFIFPLV